MDGHYHKAACFDPKHTASDGSNRATATGHFFRMNMRTHHMSCLAMAEPKDGKKREHDIDFTLPLHVLVLIYCSGRSHPPCPSR